MAIKKFKVTASAEAKRAVSASTIDRLDDIQFVMQKYVDGHGGITLVKDYNNGEFDVEYNGVTVHLKFILDDPTEFVYTMDTSDNVYAHSSYEYIIPDIWKYVDYSVLANDVEGACGKKSIKSATKAKKAVTAGTTPQDNVKPLSVGQARVFTYQGDPCVFVGVPNGMIFRWYPGSYEAKGELNYAKTVIKKYPNEWEEILREYGFDQYDANAEYQTLSAKNPVKSSTKRKPTKKVVKASATAKRVAASYGVAENDNKRFHVTALDEPNRGIAEYMQTNDLSNAESAAHDWLMHGYYVQLNDSYTGDNIIVDPDVYAENFDGEFWCTPELVEWRDEVWRSMGINASTKKTVKASASAKRRASKRITASDTSNDIVMYFNGDNVYQGSVYDLADAVENLCYDEDVNAKFQQWCNQFGDPIDFDGSPIDTAAVFTDIIIHEADEAEEHSDFYEDGDGILDFEIFYADDAVEGSVKKSVKASIDSDYDTKVLRELEDYIKDNYPIYVDTEYAVYENENDWSVGLFATLGMVESDFEYYLNEQNPYLYNRLTETGLIGGPSVNNAVGANDFQFQLYPAQDQWRGPQLDIDETNLANAGDDGSVYAELKTQIDAFEIMYINALQELNYHMSDLLRKYDEGQGIHASTDVNADLQLNKYPGDRKKYSYNKNSITDIDGYVQDIADGVVEKFPDLEYEISDEAITFTRDGNVIYVQSIDEIVPERDDLNDDIDELASAIQMDDELNAMRKDFDAGWNATYDSDTATRAVEMSVDDDLEPIMGDDFEEEDMGFGFTTSGEAISESMVDELCRIANEILEKSELAKYDEYTSIDRDTFDYWSDGSTYVSEKFYIYFTFTQNGGWFINNNMVDFSDSRGISETEEFTFECDISIKDGEVVEVLYNDMPDNYSADMIDVPALTEYIEKLATPVARDIYNGTTNI